MFEDHLKSVKALQSFNSKSKPKKVLTDKRIRNPLKELIEKRASAERNVRLLKLMSSKKHLYKYMGELIESFYLHPSAISRSNFCCPLRMQLRTLYRISQRYKVSLDYLLEFTEDLALDPLYQVERFEEVALERDLLEDIFLANLQAFTAAKNLDTDSLAELVGMSRATVYRWLGSYTTAHLPKVENFCRFKKVMPELPIDAWLREGAHV